MVEEEILAITSFHAMPWSLCEHSYVCIMCSVVIYMVLQSASNEHMWLGSTVLGYYCNSLYRQFGTYHCLYLRQYTKVTDLKYLMLLACYYHQLVPYS